MKLTNKQLKSIVEEEINQIFEGGAQQLIGQYNIQVITEDSEVLKALDVIRKYVKKRADYTYGIEEYKSVLGAIDEASSLIETIIEKKEEEKNNLTNSPSSRGEDSLRRQLRKYDSWD